MNEIWTKQFGGDNSSLQYFKYEYLNSLFYDPASNCIYVYGDYVGSIDLGNITLSTGTFDKQVYIAKFTLDGNCIWAKQSGSQSDNVDDKTCFATNDNLGNVFICAYFPYNGSFGNVNVGYGVYLAQYDSEGNYLWSKRIIEISNSGAFPTANLLQGKVIDNNLYILGDNSSYSFTIDTITTNNPNYNGRFLAKLDLLGNIIWIKQFGGPVKGTSSNKIITDDQNNIYLTGSFNAIYGTFGPDTLYSNASTEMYIMKCNPEGNNIWLQQSNATSLAYSLGLTGMLDDKFYIVGGFNETIHFGNITLVTSLEKEMYLACFTKDGICINAKSAGTGIGYDFVTDLFGNLYVCGDIFGTCTFGNIVLTSYGENDMFIAKHEKISSPNKIQKRNFIPEDLIIYANPTTGICNISIPEELQNEENLTLQVYDNTGKLILQQEIGMQEGKISMNLEAQAKGIYQAVLTNGKKKYSGKVVFE